MTYYNHIKRFERLTDRDKFYLFNTNDLYVQPKLDGTFGRVDPGLKCFSKKVNLTEFNGDNRGFKQYIQDNADTFNKVPENWALFGEWLVPHTIKLYNEDAWRKFYVFDVFDLENEKYILPEDWIPVLNALKIDIVSSIIYNVNEFNKDTILNKHNWGFLLPDDQKDKFEGVVVKNYNTGKFAKIINPVYTKEKARVNKPVKKDNIEAKIARKYIDIHTVNKRYEEVKGEENFIPKLLGTIYYDLIKDEMWSILKKFHNPTINFRNLQAEVNKRIKELKPEVF